MDYQPLVEDATAGDLDMAIELQRQFDEEAKREREAATARQQSQPQPQPQLQPAMPAQPQPQSVQPRYPQPPPRVVFVNGPAAPIAAPQVQQMQVQQQPAQNDALVNQPLRWWKHGLCSCCEECGVCCLATVAPCFVNMENAEMRERRSACDTCLVSFMINACTPFYPCYAACERGKTRRLRNIPGNFCEDCLLMTFCQPCALTQEYRELDSAVKAGELAPAPQVMAAEAARQQQQQQNPNAVPSAPPMYA